VFLAIKSLSDDSEVVLRGKLNAVQAAFFSPDDGSLRVDKLRSEIDDGDWAPDEIQVRGAVGLIHAVGRSIGRAGACGRHLDARAQPGAPEVAKRDEAAYLARETKRAVLVHVAVGKESSHLIAADRIAQVEVQAHVILAARRNDP